MTPHTDTMDWLEKRIFWFINDVLDAPTAMRRKTRVEPATKLILKDVEVTIANKLAQSKKALFLELISECEPIFGAAGGVAINRQSLIDKVEAL